MKLTLTELQIDANVTDQQEYGQQQQLARFSHCDHHIAGIECSWNQVVLLLFIGL